MRRSTSRLLISLLLALAIPVQAIAGVAEGMCLHDDAVMHDHESADHHHGDAPSDKTAGDAHCAPCAGCCATTAISSFALLLLPAGPAAAHVAARLPWFCGIQPDGLDRPPLAL
jgi:hypothetical protein